MKHEALLQNPQTHAQQMCQFLGLEPDPDTVSRAVEARSFKAMRRMEEKAVEIGEQPFFNDRRFSSGRADGARFMNSGTRGKGVRQLSSAQRRQGMQTFGDVMAKLGYSPKGKLKRSASTR